jgi:hypothetical protein
MIQRFEDEYPDCRLLPFEEAPEQRIEANSEGSSGSQSPSLSTSQATSTATSSSQNGVFRPRLVAENVPGYKAKKEGNTEMDNSDSEEDESAISHPLRRSSRHASDVSLAVKALSREEGRVHRIGTKVQADLMQKGIYGELEGECEAEVEHDHLAEVRSKLRELEMDDPLRAPQSPI